MERHPEQIALVGAAAAEPAPACDWIVRGPLRTWAAAGPLWAAREWVRATSIDRARRLWAAGSLRNTSVVVAKARTLVNAARPLRRPLVEELASAVTAGESTQGDRELARIYAGLAPVSLAGDILEQCPPILAVSRVKGLAQCGAGSP